MELDCEINPDLIPGRRLRRGHDLLEGEGGHHAGNVRGEERCAGCQSGLIYIFLVLPKRYREYITALQK